MILIPNECFEKIEQIEHKGWVIYFAILLYGQMLMLRNPDNYVYHTDRQLEKITKRDHTNMRRCLTALEDAGMIKQYYDGKDRAFIEMLILPTDEEIDELKRRF